MQVKYTQGEEFANAITHAIGALLSIYGIVMLAVMSSTPVETATTAIFGATMFILFQASTVYHAITYEPVKKVLQKIDHSAIYLLIAGTYTPILLLTVPFPHSVAILAMIWYLAIMGIIFSCITLKFKNISLALYLLMSWILIFLFYHIWITSSHLVVLLLLAGGVCYSGGCIFYRSTKSYRHSVWHLFVLAGAICHYFAIVELLHVR